MITVHHLAQSRSQRVLWLLEELGLDYEIAPYLRDPATQQAPAALREAHSLGKAPVIVDGETTVAESGAIIEYLVGKFGKDSGLRPPEGSPDRLRYTYWLHYAEGSAMTPLLLGQAFARLPETSMPFFMRPIAARVARSMYRTRIRPQIAVHLDFMEAALDKSQWFAGAAFSAADIQMSFPVEAIVAHFGPGAHRRRLVHWLIRIHARPAYQRAIANGRVAR